MRYHYISDSHVHSDCSFDGTDPVMMICERAAALGLYSIAVTDHCECDIYYKEGFDRSVVQSFFETRKARAVFYGRLQVYAGIELGQPITCLLYTSQQGFQPHDESIADDQNQYIADAAAHFR